MMKRILKFSILAVVIANLFLITSCEENLQTSCDDFSVSVDNVVVDSSSVTLTANPIGGVPDYVYAWSNGESTQSIDVTIQDTYSVTVTDGDDCTASIDVVVEALTVSITETTEANGSTLEAMVAGGVEPYTYLWSNGELTSSIFVTSEGSYSVTVTDADGNQAIGFYYVVGPCTGFQGYIYSTIEPASTDSTLNVNIINGTAPFTYSWSNGQTLPTITPTDSGTYNVEVTDANGCTFTASYFLAGPCTYYSVSITEEFDPTSMGFILVSNIQNGTAPFEYLWLNGETSANINVDASGTYTVEVTDANDCSYTASYEYSNVPCEFYDVMIQSSTDSLSMDVTLSVNITDGIPAYQYIWSNGESTATIDVGQQTGSFSVTVVDAVGCVEEDTIQL